MENSRRNFIQFLVGAFVSGSVFTLFKASPARALARPPAALVEDDFLKFCTRCHQCIDVCPADALHPASILDGITNIGTPVLDGPKCILCMECVRICPTPAIKKIPKQEIVLGKAVINTDSCLAWQKKKRCKDCYRACKSKAIKLKKRRYPEIIADKCNGCGLCVQRCPAVAGTLEIKYDQAERYPADASHFALCLENRVAPYEFAPDDFGTWLKKRITKIGKNHGLTMAEKEDQ